MATYKVYEYVGSFSKEDRKLMHTCKSAKEACSFINTQYKMHTKPSNLIDAIEQNYGDAWIYPFWGAICVVKE